MTPQVAIINLSQLPPSSNNLFLSAGNRRVKTPRYRGWLDVAGWEIATQRPAKIAGPYALTIWLERPKRRRDLDNAIKGLSDLLTQQRVIEDDSLCQKLSAEWSNQIKGVRIMVASTRGE